MSDEVLGGPYLQVAALRENVIEDRHGVLSLIRVVDRFTITTAGPDAPEKMPPTPISGYMVLAFKSGFAKGSHTIKIRPRTPDQQNLPELTVPIHLEGDDRGSNIVMPLRMVLEQEGLYWFDVYVNDSLITRMPLRLIYQRLSVRP